MFEKLKALHEEREEGFTLIELLVVILIIGILAAIAIPAFLNQRQTANDGATESDVKNATTAVESWIVGQKGKKVDITPTVVTTMDIKTSEGVTIDITGNSNGYCITGTHANGKIAANEGYVFASNEGKISTEGKSCLEGNLTSGTVTPPAGNNEEPPASAAGTTYSGTMYSNGSETINFSYAASRSTNGTWSFSSITVSGDDTTGQLDMTVNDPSQPYDPEMGPMGASLYLTNGTGTGTSFTGGPDVTFTPNTFTANSGLQYYYYD